MGPKLFGTHSLRRTKTNLLPAHWIVDCHSRLNKKTPNDAGALASLLEKVRLVLRGNGCAAPTPVKLVVHAHQCLLDRQVG
jgi:hypothetical protein